jgi:hypothetical protein
MKKFLIFSLIGIVVIVALIAIIGYVNVKKEKSFSPEDSETFAQGDLSIKVLYNRPFKKDRVIFGGLVPYDKVWRTGANESTTFQTNKDIVIEGQKLRAGKYSLWTIPGPEIWTVIFNSEYGQWGINSKAEANREPSRDVLSVVVKSLEQDQVFEQFTISFDKTGEDAEMVLIWDKTLVAVPFSWKQ